MALGDLVRKLGVAPVCSKRSMHLGAVHRPHSHDYTLVLEAVREAREQGPGRHTKKGEGVRERESERARERESERVSEREKEGGAQSRGTE